MDSGSARVKNQDDRQSGSSHVGGTCKLRPSPRERTLITRCLGDAVTQALQDLGFGGGEGEHPLEMDEHLLKWSIWAGENKRKNKKT